MTPPRAAALAAVLLACGPSASAPVQAHTMQQKLDAACASDAARFCADAKADADALKACLLSHRAVVDAACMQLVDASE